MYDQKLADRILEVLNEAYPEKLQSETELQSRLTEYQGTPQEEWFKALDALHGDGLIDGKFLRTGIDQKLQGAALLSITWAGREWLRARLTVQGSLSSVGEPTVESYDFRSILPETPTIPEGISAESANLLVCAFDLTEGSAELEEFNFSFTSILVAFLASDDPLSRWFQSFAAQHESQFEQLLKHRNVSRARLDEVRAKKPDASNIQRVLNRKPRPTWTSSAQAVLTAANDLKRSVSVPGSSTFGT